MKLIDIANRLKEEFPNETVFFSVKAAHYGEIRFGVIAVEISVYCCSLNEHIVCENLEDGISQIKRNLAGFEGAKNVDIEDATSAGGVMLCQTCQKRPY